MLDFLRIDGASVGLTVAIYAVGIMAMLLSVIAYQFKYRVTIIVVNFSGQACWVLYFLLQSDFTSAVSCAITVAVMGCVVNGPGEAREADVGVAGGKGEAVLFRKGEIVCKITEENIVPVLWDEINRLLK